MVVVLAVMVMVMVVVVVVVVVLLLLFLLLLLLLTLLLLLLDILRIAAQGSPRPDAGGGQDERGGSPTHAGYAPPAEQTDDALMRHQSPADDEMERLEQLMMEEAADPEIQARILGPGGLMRPQDHGLNDDVSFTGLYDPETQARDRVRRHSGT